MGKIETEITNIIDSLSPEQIVSLRKILFQITNKDLINKVKKIYEQPNSGAGSSDIAVNKNQ